MYLRLYLHNYRDKKIAKVKAGWCEGEGCPSTREQFGPCVPLFHPLTTPPCKIADKSLQNYITGINSNEDVNGQDLFEIGKDIVQKMYGQPVFFYSHKRSLKAKTLASSKNGKVSADHSIDPALLFQRFLVISQSGDLRLDVVMSFELSLNLMSLFEGK